MILFLTTAVRFPIAWLLITSAAVTLGLAWMPANWADSPKAASLDVSAADRSAHLIESLFQSIQQHEVERIVQFLQSGGDANARNAYGVTPLIVACQCRDAAIAQRLLSAGADPNVTVAGQETALMVASRSGAQDCVQLLLDHGAQVDAKSRGGQTALMWAAAEGHVAVLDLLLRAGADPEITLESGFTALTFAAREGRSDAVHRLINTGLDANTAMSPKDRGGRAPREGMSALMIAVESGHFDLAIELIKLGADPNDQRSGYTPLHAITWVRKTNRGDGIDGDPPPRGSGQRSSLDFVRDLVSAGADVNVKLRRGPGGRAQLNHRGASPFLLAAKTADPSATNIDGCTPLMAAAGVGVVAVGEEPGTEEEVLATIDYLVSLGADVNAVDGNGETAMHGAAYRNFPDVASRLAHHGADPEVWDHENKWGWTPLRIAQGYRPGSFKPSPPTIAALKAAGAK